MLENIVTDLETSKRLKELGFDRESWFVWAEIENKWQPLFNTIDLPTDHYHKAYTLEQILKELPNDKEIRIDYKSWFHGINYDDKINVYQQEGDNLATTAAKLWIELKESRII